MNCNKCNEDLSNAKSAVVNGKNFCLDCLRCLRCFSYQVAFEKDNNFYCQKCKDDLEKGIIRNCDYCNKPFADGEEAITDTDINVWGLGRRDGKKYYHKSCSYAV